MDSVLGVLYGSEHMFDIEILPSDLDLLDPDSGNDHGLPADLESIPPGLQLGVILSSVDRDQLSGYDRVRLLKADARMVAHFQARVYSDIHSVSESVTELHYPEAPNPQDIFETASSEVQASLSLTRRSADIHVELASLLCERLPRVWAALHAGLIDLARARILSDLTMPLPRELAREVTETALVRAPSMTTGQLRAHLGRLIISVDPAAAQERYEQKLEERRVFSEQGEDGTANLHGLNLPPDEANRAMRRINRLARALKAKGDRRRIDQIRADILLDLLTGKGQPNGSCDKGVVEIRVDLTTLAGIDDDPAEIPGFGPVLADVARQMVDEASDAEWRIIPVDGNGQPVGVVTTKRRPTTSQKRIVESRNPTCVFPGCRMPAAECDLNHEVPWAEAHRTTARELEPLCRHDHINHHLHRWKLKQIRSGIYQWTSPLGHTYTTGPEPR
ncbi:MAG: endonuclease [Acidimicrobiia bacterium]|nr:endonuclease [Acidimicrobiia bacterium]